MTLYYIPDLCESEADITTECQLYEGYFTLFLKNSDDDMVNTVQTAAQLFVKAGMDNSTFDEAHEGIVSLSYLGAITPSQITDEIPQNREIENASANRFPVYGWVLIASCSAFVAGLVSHRKLSNQSEGSESSRDSDQHYDDLPDDWSSNYVSQRI